MRWKGFNRCGGILILIEAYIVISLGRLGKVREISGRIDSGVTYTRNIPNKSLQHCSLKFRIA
jgi:hypothetical protein